MEDPQSVRCLQFERKLQGYMQDLPVFSETKWRDTGEDSSPSYGTTPSRFYEKLNALQGKLSRSDIAIVVGDRNARVGSLRHW